LRVCRAAHGIRNFGTIGYKMDIYFTTEAFTALFQVMMIDLVLAGDNAIVIGLAAAGLPQHQRIKVIFWGIAAATLMRIGFASVTVQLLQLIGLLLAGGVLLLWVCWKMWRELRQTHHGAPAGYAAAGGAPIGAALPDDAPKKTFGQAVWQIIVADVSMSLDNVLAVAGASRDHPYVLIFGLILSIALMGIAANFVAQLLQKHRWIAYVGLAIILYVALDMCYRGAREVWPYAERFASLF
jgi:YjbE family integral membrane protein